MTSHHSLTDEQFADLLAGRPTSETLADLQGDADAAAELVELKSALHSYRAESLVWAERRSAAAPSLVPAARRRARWMAVPQWSLAAVAVAAVAVGIGHFSGSSANGAVAGTPAIATASASAASASPERDIASDNELLTSIDAALSYAGTSPVDGLGLKPAQDDGAQRRNVE
jgi:negative regulator of sigma E activity